MFIIVQSIKKKLKDEKMIKIQLIKLRIIDVT